MAEGIATAGGALSAVHDDPDRPPEATADAPRGWTWNRKERSWKPRVRGPLVYDAQPSAPADEAPQDDPESYGPDPAPSWASDPAPPGEKWEIDSEARADIKALVALAYTVPAETLPLLDPYCFGPLDEKKTANGVIDAVSDIVCGSPRVAKWAVSASGLMPWIKLGVALKPIGVNVLHHHITKSVEVEIDRDSKTMQITHNDWAQYPAA
jgi:hypothetical protein